LCILFLVYSFNIYLIPLHSKMQEGFDSKIASEGRLVWQKYNCKGVISCMVLVGILGLI